MSFGWSIGDVILLAQYSWKVYESFADGSLNATNEYDRFKREYRQVITCLERLADVSPDLSSLAGFDETFGDTIKFLDKHRVLTAKSTRPLITTLPQTSSRLRNFLEQFGRGYQTATWPIYRDEAEKLHAQLDRVVAIATLHATTTTLKNTQGIERQSDDIMRAVKYSIRHTLPVSLSDKVNFVLRRIAPTSFTSTSDIDLDYLTTLSHTSINQPDSLHQVIANLDRSESPEDMLRLLHQFSQKMEYLIMRDSRGVRSVTRSQALNSQGPVTTERIAPVLQLLDSARTVADTALGLPRTQNRVKEHSASASLEARVDDWDVFGQWLKWHMLHDISPEPIQPNRTARLAVVAPNQSPPTSPGAREVPQQYLTGQPRDISPSIIGSPLPEPVWTPSTEAYSTPGTIFTSASSQRRFLSIDLGSSYIEETTQFSSATWPLNFLTKDSVLEMYHVPSGGTNRNSAFIPWIDNSRVHKPSINEARLQFKGSHQVIVKDEKTHRSTIYNTRPVYRFDELEGIVCTGSGQRCYAWLTSCTDLLHVQEQLLGKCVVATFDVVRIATRAGQDQCASETLRVLEDAERQRSVLYYAHKMPSKSANTNSGFVEWSCKSMVSNGLGLH
ncbi:hypothetical protein E4T50_06220 [Aureobasidium sp. EXF-12298]|nr:hypothetical protein E4T50_06220 [Aureobasidium sp. EXF-12298]KAI4759397.1 hypothetical protein E4T51_07573 [Aureobasidium sp. EXF-12344]KAI4777435.1 hypothetical protein E4T52_07631 [Aureobasidium sp. EXF-3400]